MSQGKSIPDTVAKRANWESAPLRPNEFRQVGDGGTIDIDPDKNVEILLMEVGEDGRLSPYNLFWLGEEASAEARDSRGKIRGTFKNGSGDEMRQGTEIRFVRRLKTESKRDELSRWYDVRELNEDRKEFQEALPPAENEQGDPMFVTDGELIVVEMRHPYGDSETLDYEKTYFKAPGYAGA